MYLGLCVLVSGVLGTPQTVLTGGTVCFSRGGGDRWGNRIGKVSPDRNLVAYIT